MKTPKAADVRRGISVLWDTLQCPICLDLMTAPVSTKCDHQFCKFCLLKLLDNSKQNRAACPVCKANITKRSLQESPGFQRLVAGLQDMIQAYEHDTGTNYFTGLTWRDKHSTETDAETTEHACETSSRDTRDADPSSEKNPDQDNPPQSNTSTAAAENGFARLMGYNESNPVAAENEGLDSGLGDAPATSDKKMDSSSDDLELLRSVPDVVEEAPLNQAAGNKKSLVVSPTSSSIPDEIERRLSRKSSRKKQKKEAGKSLEQKKKKSLEKVAEWLMKVPPEGGIELEEPDENGDDSDSCSSASTIDIKQHNSDISLKTEVRGKALEEQVFGAVYKRKVNRTFSPPPDIFVEPPSTTETQECEGSSGKTKEISLSDADLVTQEVKETNDTSSDFFKELMEGNDASTRVEEVNNVQESAQNKDKQEFICPASSTRKRTRRTLQLLDSDLTDRAEVCSEAPELKKPDKRKGRNTRSEKSRPTRAPKPLVLVEVQNGESEGPKMSARSEEVQVHIESYSSSEDQEASLLRRTRRSRRLQVFAEEVQESSKKANPRSRASGKKGGETKRPENVQGETLEEATQPQNESKVGAVKRNGCVFDEDIGDIENLSCQKRAKTNESVAEVPNSQTRSEVSPACSVSVVPNSITTSDVVDPTLNSNKPAGASQTGAQLEASVCENEEENNDCEVDTEQLLRSFKATKRKSFHLGGPELKRSCSTDRDGEAEMKRRDETEAAKPSEADRAASRETEESARSCSGQGRNSQSSVLTPNQVSRSAVESTSLSVVPQVVDSGLRFTLVEHEDINKSSKCSQTTENQLSCTVKDAGKVKQMGDGVLLDNSSAQNAEHISIAESSLTPDGLVAPDVRMVHEAKTNSHGSGGTSVHSSIKSNARKKRRAQRLESSGSSGSEEELPSLTQIFGTSVRPNAAVNQDQGDAPVSEANAPEEEPQSPDCVSPSQGSEDLFGTPDECDVPANNTEASIESSQFSSEVLVTQQKIEMQKELARLEKLMALVSEVLHEKEGSPSKQVPPEAHPIDAGGVRVPNQDADQSSDRRNVPEAQRDPRPGSPDVTEVTAPALPTRDGIAETAGAGLSVKPSKMPNSTSAAKTVKNSDSPNGQEDKENNSPPKDGPEAKLVLVSSGLGPSEKMMVKKFAKRVGARVASQLTPEVTHVIMCTDEQLVCERTLKYFLGIAGRKWVVSFQWISECFKQRKLLDESPFEVRGDVVNGSDHRGPSRARATEDGDLLMKGYKICFQGPFTDMTTDEMEWMAELCGAAVVKDPLLFDGKQKSHQLIVVQPRSDSSSSTSSSLSRHATVVSRGWLLDSVATYRLQNYSNYAT